MQTKRESKKAKPQMKKPAAAKPKGEVMKKPSGAKPKGNKPRGIENQHTICTIIARSGGDTFPKSKSFRYVNSADEKAARKKAAAWLKDN
jgi:hypothetical protein